MAHTRKFIDSDGIHWQVYELSDDSDDSAVRERGWLYFFSRDATKFLCTYPDDWAVMDWPGLELLCKHARPPVRRDSMRPVSTMGQGAEL